MRKTQNVLSLSAATHCISRPTMTKDTMKAVVFKGPHKVVIEDRPIPKIKDQTDIIVKVDKVCA